MPRRHAMLTQVSAGTNNNKFYEVTMEEDGRVWVRWGRMYAKGQTKDKGHGDRVFDACVAEKLNKRPKPGESPYVKADIMVKDSASGQAQHSLIEVAKRDLLGEKMDPNLSALIDRLVALNRHQLMAASGGNIEIVNGQVQTAVGLVTLSTVQSARQELQELQKLVERHRTQDTAYLQMLNRYLNHIPQRVPAKAGWGPSFFDEVTSFTKQTDLLDQLEASIQLVESAPAPVVEDKPVARMFGYGLELNEDKKVFEQIQKFYKSSINPQHVSSRLRLKRVYTLSNAAAQAAFEKRSKEIGNIQRLWHGTRAHNVLSITKSGLIVPSGGGSYTITGRMFGDGLYFSDQSSKSLNYAYGYWDRQGYDDNCYMFLCDVAMGKMYTPSHPGNGKRAGYDSCFAKANQSGVRNNEMIVYNINQAHLTHLCEFDR